MNKTAHKDGVKSVAISPNGKYIVSGGCDNTVKIWDIETGECLKILNEHEYSVNHVAISRNSKYIFSADAYIIKIWDFDSGECLNTFEEEEEEIDSLIVINDKYIATLCFDEIKILGIETATNLYYLQEENTIKSINVSSDFEFLITGSDISSMEEDEVINIWNINTNRLLRTIDDDFVTISSLLITDDKKSLIFGDCKDIKIVDFVKGKCVDILEGHENFIEKLIKTSDEKYLISCDKDTIKIWDLNEKVCLRTLKGHESIKTSVFGRERNCIINSLAITPDGKYVVSGSDDETIKIWDFETGDCLKTL